MRHLAPSLALYLTLLLSDAFFGPAHAIRIHGQRKPRSEMTARERNVYGLLGRRAPMQSDLQNSGDVTYYTNISLGTPPTQFSVLIDTGR